MGEGRQEIVLTVVHACPGHIAIGLLMVGARHTDDKRCADACCPPSLVRGECFFAWLVGLVLLGQPSRVFVVSLVGLTVGGVAGCNQR